VITVIELCQSKPYRSHTHIADNRGLRFAEAVAKAQEIFPMVGGSGGKRQVRDMGRAFLAELFTPLLEVIARKRKWMEVQVEHLGEHAALLAEYQKCPSYELMTRLESLEDTLRKTRPMAFSHETRKVQDQYMGASQYDDQWSETRDNKGRLNKVCAYYVCENNTANWSTNPVCATLTLSKVWLRQNPTGATAVKKQKWYCPSCSGRYRASYGMMVQVTLDYGGATQSDWCMLADCTDKDIDDIRACFHEQTMMPKSPQELFLAIPDRIPSLSSGTLRPARIEECQYAKDWNGSEGKEAGRPLNYGIFKITNLSELKQLARFDWNQIFNFMK
jgi:hypothetical protein